LALDSGKQFLPGNKTGQIRLKSSDIGHVAEKDIIIIYQEI